MAANQCPKFMRVKSAKIWVTEDETTKGLGGVFLKVTELDFARGKEGCLWEERRALLYYYMKTQRVFRAGERSVCVSCLGRWRETDHNSRQAKNHTL